MIDGKFWKRYGQLEAKRKVVGLDVVEKAEFHFMLEAYLADFQARDPEGFKEKYDQYRVSAEEFKERTGRSPEEFIRKN